MLSLATNTQLGIERMSFCVEGPKLNKLNLTNLTLDTQNDIRSIPNRVLVANESKSLSDWSYQSSLVIYKLSQKYSKYVMSLNDFPQILSHDQLSSTQMNPGSTILWRNPYTLILPVWGCLWPYFVITKVLIKIQKRI